MFNFENGPASLAIGFKSALLKVGEKIKSSKNILKPPFPMISYDTEAAAEAEAFCEKLILKVHEIYSTAAATIVYRPHLGCFSFIFMKFLKAPFLQCW